MGDGEEGLAPEPPARPMGLEPFDEVADYGLAHPPVDQRLGDPQRESGRGRDHEGSNPTSRPRAMRRIAPSAARSSFWPALVTRYSCLRRPPGPGAGGAVRTERKPFCSSRSRVL